jgi:hypothetical protein
MDAVEMSEVKWWMEGRGFGDRGREGQGREKGM